MSKKLFFAIIKLFIFGSFIFPDSFGMLGSFMRCYEIQVTTVISTNAAAKVDVEVTLDSKRHSEWKSVVGLPGKFVDQSICSLLTTTSAEWCDEAGVSK